MYSSTVYLNELVAILVMLIASVYFVTNRLTLKIKTTMSEVSQIIQEKLDNLQAAVDTLQDKSAKGFEALKEQLAAATESGLSPEEAQAIVAKIDEIAADVASTEVPSTEA